MKQKKPITKSEKKVIYKTADCFLRKKQEKIRHEKAVALDKEFNYA